MVYVRFRAGADEAKRVCEAARREGVLFLLPKPDTARLVTHLDVDDSGIDAALAVFRRLLGA
jgi:threonine aldolase